MIDNMRARRQGHEAARLLAALGFFLLMITWSATPAAAQEAEDAAAPDSLRLGAWAVDLAGTLSASQAAYRNWTEGGISSLALTSSFGGSAERSSNRWTQAYELRLAFGIIKQDTLDVRKADDVIRLSAAYRYRGRGFFRTFKPTVAAEARTQFAAGYSYDEVPPELEGRATPVKVSDFMAPGVFTQTVGLTYEPAPWLRQRFGVGLKETVVAIERLRPLYALDPGSPVRFEAGFDAQTAVDREVFENVRLQSTLGLFSAFSQIGELPDVSWQNIVTMQVNRWLGVNLEFTTLYDRDISRALQVKEVLSVGVTVVVI